MFDDNFEVFLADTLESKKIHYAIRYQVYCEEMDSLDSHSSSLGLEKDEYDASAVHFIIRHIQSNQWIGAMRLIFRQSDSAFPMEKYCTFFDYADLNGINRSVELSRLCVIKEIRRGICETAALYGIPEKSSDIRFAPKSYLNGIELALSRNIIFGVLKAASEYCYQHQIKDWYFLSTSTLSKVFRKSGLNLVKIGKACSFYGERYPIKMDALEIYKHQVFCQNDRSSSYRLFSQVSSSDFDQQLH